MENSFSLMVTSYLLALANFLYGYREAIKISNEEGLVNGWGLIFSLPLGFYFSYLATFFHEITL
jgi:hypothetical protein